MTQPRPPRKNAPYRMTVEQFMALPEYSTPVPTGVRDGKTWRRHHRWTPDGGRTVRVKLMVGRYHDFRQEVDPRTGKPATFYSTSFHDVVFRVRAGSAPCAWPL